MSNIVLIGMMGSGKTTVGKLLSESIHQPFIDTDALIEERFGSIHALFERGEETFRAAEHTILDEVSQLDGYILSTGGGVVKNKDNIELLRKNGLVFFLDRPVSMIIKDIDVSTRPLLKNGPDILYKLYEERLPLYLTACHHRIDSSVSVYDVVSEIRKICLGIGLST